ncbi:MAG: ATP-dependent sacrificial sulfur transferase LarE [Planctomycetota bacterium]
MIRESAADSAYGGKLRALEASLDALPGAVVAFSGGVDSTALLHACAARLCDRVVAVTADSPSLPRRELSEARELAGRIGVRHIVLATRELDREDYRRNGRDRCYHCKRELFLTVAARRSEVAPPEWPVVFGAIADDLSDHRPGWRAARELGVLAPLADAGFSKPDVRRYSRDAGLPTAEKPSMACLSSRVPYGTKIDRLLLSRVERSEDALRALGFRQLRVRHHGDVARVEIDRGEIARAFDLRSEIAEALRRCGYTYVALDLEGFRSGSMNES